MWWILGADTYVLRRRLLQRCFCHLAAFFIIGDVILEVVMFLL